MSRTPRPHATARLLVLALAGTAASAGSQGEVDLPAGAVAEVVGRALADPAAASALPPDWPTWPAWSDGGEDGWGGEPAWRDWVELLRAETDADAPDPARRARLALLAADQGRSSDAWRHLLAAGPAPLVAAVLPALLPGVPPALLAREGPLPAGVLLRPALPPPRDGADWGRLASLVGRDMRDTGILVEGTRFELRLVVEGDGVQVDLIHRSGPPVRVQLLLPLPSGVELGQVYANWEGVGEGRFPLELEVGPEPQRQTVWGRFRPRPERWPEPPPAGWSGDERRAGPALLVVVPVERRGEARLARFAEALAELFDRPARLTTPADAQRSALFEPIAIHIGPAEEQPRARSKLVGMVSLLETHALARSGGR